MWKWAASRLRPLTPDEETAGLRAQIQQLQEHVKELTQAGADQERRADDALAELRQAETTNESLDGQLHAAHDNLRERETELKLSRRECQLLEQIVENQQSRQERDAKINIAAAEAALQQVDRLARGLGTGSVR